MHRNGWSIGRTGAKMCRCDCHASALWSLIFLFRLSSVTLLQRSAPPPPFDAAWLPTTLSGEPAHLSSAHLQGAPFRLSNDFLKLHTVHCMLPFMPVSLSAYVIGAMWCHSRSRAHRLCKILRCSRRWSARGNPWIPACSSGVNSAA